MKSWRKLVLIAADAAEKRGAHALEALEVGAATVFADCFLMVSGRSERNVAAIAGAVEEALYRAGCSKARVEGRNSCRWVLLDFGDLVVHVFHEEEREFYGLSRLWNDCPPVELRSTGVELARN